MPTRDVNTWTIAAWVATNQAWIFAGAVAFVMAILRAGYIEAKIRGRHIAEACMCFVFVSVSRPLFEPLPWVNDDGALIVGAIVGVAGARIMIPAMEAAARAFGSRKQ